MIGGTFLPTLFRDPKEFFTRYERRISASAFLFGFVLDNLTLQRIDRLYDNIMLAAYLLIALSSIIYLNAHAARLRRGAAALWGNGAAQFFLPFSLGGLFSGFLVFYSRSGPLLSNIVFLIGLFALFVGSEFFKKHYERFVFQMCVFFVALFSYSVIIVPVLLRRMGDGIFLLSGAFSLLVFFLALKAIRRVAKEEVDANRRLLRPLIFMIFITFNFLYFNNMIPPIPLSLKEIGVYHAVERFPNGEYRLSFESPPWYALRAKTSSVFHRNGDEPAFVFSSVYAPLALTTDILHRWSYFDELKHEWVTAYTVEFPISGGRIQGFRGYSVKEHLTLGKWRVSVETLRGQIIGRLDFTVEESIQLILKEATR